MKLRGFAQVENNPEQTKNSFKEARPDGTTLRNQKDAAENTLNYFGEQAPTIAAVVIPVYKPELRLHRNCTKYSVPYIASNRALA